MLLKLHRYDCSGKLVNTERLGAQNEAGALGKWNIFVIILRCNVFRFQFKTLIWHWHSLVKIYAKSYPFFIQN